MQHINTPSCLDDEMIVTTRVRGTVAVSSNGSAGIRASGSRGGFFLPTRRTQRDQRSTGARTRIFINAACLCNEHIGMHSDAALRAL